MKAVIGDLIASAPGTLDTLKEIADSLANDPNLSGTLTTSIALKAPLESPAFTGTVTGISAAMIGLGNVDNTSDVNKPVSTAQQTALNLKANLESPTFTGTVSGIDKTMVGLGNVDNTSDVNKPVSTAQQTALDLKANLESPTFTGTVSAPTVASSNNSTHVATTAYVKAVVGDLIDSAPTTLDTLKEIADALGNDPNLSGTLTTAIGLKAPLANPTFTGTVTGISATMVGLGNVDNTSDVNKPVSTAQQTSLNLKANLESPTFTGTVSGITKSMVGLSNVDNTSDVNKPVSTAVSTAINNVTSLVNTNTNNILALYRFFNQTYSSVSLFPTKAPTILSAFKLNSNYVPVDLTWSYQLYDQANYRYFWVLHHVGDGSPWRYPVEITNISTDADGIMTASFIVGEYIGLGDSIKIFVKNEADENSPDSNVMLLDVGLDPLGLDGGLLYPERIFRTGASSSGSINNDALFQISSDNGVTYSEPVGMINGEYISSQLDIGTTYKIRAYYTQRGKTSPYTYSNFTVTNQ
ncbi:MAG: hypothetical protein EB170_08970, partial [Nitrosopumilaceae archaeon]|nr:hypothetical protein [Nitrosopumilaceae archaeon]